jgi:hypothetical protein
MPKYLLFYIVILFQPGLPAQINTDSLWTIWNDSTHYDTSRLNAIFDICNYMVRNYKDSGLVLANMMLELSTVSGHKNTRQKHISC